MAIPSQAFFVADRLRNRLAQRDADVLDRVVRIDLQIAGRFHRQIDHPWRATWSSM